MNKFNLIVSFCLIFVLFSSCAPDLTSDVEYAYAHPSIAFGSDCHVEGAFICSSDGNMSLKCVRLVWQPYQTCDSYCDENTGKCDSCTTIDGNMWSPRSSYEMNWDDAVAYCNNLTECGYSDWRLPTISELRTLIQNCSGTVTGGSCAVTDPTCLSVDECWDHSDCSCAKEDGTVNNDVYAGYYSKLGDDNVWLWSSSTATALDYSGSVWGINFAEAYVGPTWSLNSGNARCVRNAE